MFQRFGSDAYASKGIAERVETFGVVKARLPSIPRRVLRKLVGAFVGMGPPYFIVLCADPRQDFAASQMRDAAHSQAHIFLAGQACSKIPVARIGTPVRGMFSGACCAMRWVWMDLGRGCRVNKMVAVAVPIGPAFVAARRAHHVTRGRLIPVAVLRQASGSAITSAGVAGNLVGVSHLVYHSDAPNLPGEAQP